MIWEGGFGTGVCIGEDSGGMGYRIIRIEDALGRPTECRRTVARDLKHTVSGTLAVAGKVSGRLLLGRLEGLCIPGSGSKAVDLGDRT